MRLRLQTKTERNWHGSQSQAAVSLKLGLGVLTGVAKQLFRSLFWYKEKVGLPLEGEAKQPSSHHLTAERFFCFPRWKQMNRLSQFLYDDPTNVYGGSSSSQPSSLVCSFPLSSSTSSTRWPRSLSPSLPDDVAAADQLEPALESLLRSLEVHDSVIMAMRVNEVLDRALSTDLAQDEQGVWHRYDYQREMAKLIGAWRQSKTQSEVEQAADAGARAHGEPVGILAMDWNSLMEKFRQKYSPDLCENELPAQSYFEEFEESLAEGRLEAERLRDVVSEEEAQEQRKLKADPARHYGMHLDGKLTLQTRRKFTSSEPSNRNNSERNSQSCMWLLAQLRQPGRSLYKDFTRTTFEDHLKLLLSRKNFNYRKEVDGQLLAQPCWSHCLSYEYEIRKDAYKLCRLRALGIAEALNQVVTDNEHRTQHWFS